MEHRDAATAPAALGLNPRPADFRMHLAAGHSDGQRSIG
jgi:hypothetical protein